MASEKDFLGFSHFKCMGANETRGTANLNPRAMVGRIYVEDHQTMLHTLLALGLMVSEKIFECSLSI